MKKIVEILTSKSFITTLIVLGIMLSSTFIFAQFGPGGGGPGGGGGPVPPYVMPLTGGIGALLGFGIGAGIFFYRNKKSKKN